MSVRAVLRGVGQVFFQENALSGACFVIGIAVSSPLLGAAALLGSAIGMAAARLLKFDEVETSAGIYGFNAALVAMATFFFFQFGAASLAMAVIGGAVAALLTRALRRFAPFPTYTAPFILTTWALFLAGTAIGVARAEPGGTVDSLGFVGAATRGISQVMFQANIATAILFLAGIALGDWQHAAWVLLGSVVGTLAGSYHLTATARAVDPEALVDRALSENIALGLYGYNAALAAVALFLGRRSLIEPVLGMLLSVALLEVLPLFGLPALTAPFVLATWIVLGLAWLEARFLHQPPPAEG